MTENIDYNLEGTKDFFKQMDEYSANLEKEFYAVKKIMKGHRLGIPKEVMEMLHLKVGDHVIFYRKEENSSTLYMKKLDIDEI